MGGPSTSKADSITQQSLNLQNQEFQQSQKDQTAREALMAPAISFDSAIVGGDKQAQFAAIAPLIAQITSGSKAAKAEIMNTVPAGPGRDVALAENVENKRGAIAQTENSSYTSALDKLANLGSGIGSFSLNEAGAAISAGGLATQSNNAVMQAQSQSKASTMGFLGSLVGAGGTIAGAKIAAG